MNDFVPVPRLNIHVLCATIRNLISRKQIILEHEIKAEEEKPFKSDYPDSFFIRNDLNDLNKLLDLALDCAPDDIKNFFHNEDRKAG